MTIRVGILGYGNLSRGAESAIAHSDDMELVAVFTRRDPASVQIRTPNVPVVNVSEVESWKDKIDVMILGGGSATDLPEQTPVYAKLFNVIDSFDTHARIPEHYSNVDAAAKAAGKISIISCGWDPGLFSLARLYATAALPNGTYDEGCDMTMHDPAAPKTSEDVTQTYFMLHPGQFAIFFPEDGHAPAITPTGLHKAIIKVKA